MEKITKTEFVERFNFGSKRSKLEFVNGDFVFGATPKRDVLIFVPGDLTRERYTEIVSEVVKLGFSGRRAVWYVNGMVFYCNQKDSFERVGFDVAPD